MSLRARLSAPKLLTLAAALALAACSSAPTDRETNASPNRIYAQAKEEMQSGAWDKAVPLLERLEGRAAGTPLAQQAQLEKAYAYYRQQEPAQALATIERFMKLHPASPALDYALYLKGLVNFNDNVSIFASLTKQDLSERDQKAAKEAFESFKELVTRFPDSKYAPDARLRMAYTLNALAQYEVHVARYYYGRGAYAAAISRAQTAITDYQAVPAQEEALFILMQSYGALGMNQLRDDARRVLEKTYPKSEFLARGARTRPNQPWWLLW